MDISFWSPNRKRRLILGVNVVFLKSWNSNSIWHRVNKTSVIELLDTVPCIALQVGIAQGSAFTQMRDKVLKILLTGLCMFTSSGSEIRRFSKDSVNQHSDIERRLGWADAVMLVYQRVNLHFPMVFPFCYGFSYGNLHLSKWWTPKLSDSRPPARSTQISASDVRGSLRMKHGISMEI